MDVKRYGMSGFGGGMIEMEDGPFVGSEDFDRVTAELAALQSRLNETDAENDRLRVRALPENWENLLIAEMERRFDLGKREYDHMCVDDTQIGVEFAADFIRALENKHEQQ